MVTAAGGACARGSSRLPASRAPLTSRRPPFSYNLHNNRHTMSSDKPATRFTAGFPSPQVFTTPLARRLLLWLGLPQVSPTSAVAYARSRLASPFRSPLSSHSGTATLTSKEEFARQYQLAVDNEISRIEELERVHRWKMIQRSKPTTTRELPA